MTGLTLHPAPGSFALAFGLLVLLLSLALLAINYGMRRRFLSELDSLARMVETADPDRPGAERLDPLRGRELERLRLACAGFFERLSSSRARQEEVTRTLGYVLDHAADAILVLDHDHTIISWNGGAEETLGFSSREILGRSYLTLVPAGVEEGELAAALDPGSTVKDLRTRRICRDGRVLDVSLTRSRIPAREGSDQRFVEILRDITEARRLDEDLLRTEKMAAVGKISSKVVHEIRNPLASINLNVDLLRDSMEASADPEAKEILGVIKREIRRLSQITEEYLQFSRLPRASFRSERVNDILIELADFVRPMISRKGVRLLLNLDERDPEAVCDATLLRQALLNLLRNAMDAVDEGAGQIQMTTRALEERPSSGAADGDGGAAEGTGGEEDLVDMIEIAVEDNGRGIPAEMQPRIFEPFFTTKKDGTGLGLALVRRAVEEHAGRIRCLSLPGKGTTFRVVLPCHPPARAAAAGALIPDDQGPISPPSPPPG